MSSILKKKGSYDLSRKTLYFIICLFVIGFMFIYLAGTINKYFGIAMQHEVAVKANIAVEELISSPRCFAYYDEVTGRAYPGIIDLQKFEAGIQPGCLRYNDAAFSIALGSTEKRVNQGALNEPHDYGIRTVLVKSGDKFYLDRMFIEANEYVIMPPAERVITIMPRDSGGPEGA